MVIPISSPAVSEEEKSTTTTVGKEDEMKSVDHRINSINQ